ncbi:hypothetical protein MSPP1_001012 [Malassezia sp. CBS 17886]|nr:hypothetical protein MSPP1_001012 [Malassezia sp. CBS 17886]
MSTAGASGGRALLFTSAAFSDGALWWLWNYAVEIHPALFARAPLWGGEARGVSARRADRLRMQDVLRAPTRVPTGLRVGRAVRQLSIAPRRAPEVQSTPPALAARLNLLEPPALRVRAPGRVAQMVPPAVDVLSCLEHDRTIPRARVRRAAVALVDYADACVLTRHNAAEVRRLRTEVGARLLVLCTPDEDVSLYVRLLVLVGDIAQAQTLTAALLQTHADALRAARAVSDAGAHERHRRDAVLRRVYLAVRAVVGSYAERCAVASARDAERVAEAAAAWLWAHPLVWALVQPSFPRVTRAVYSLLASLGDPISHARALHEHAELPRSEERAAAVGLLALAYANRGGAETGAVILLEALHRGLPVREAVVRRVLRQLAAWKRHVLISTLVEQLERRAQPRAEYEDGMRAAGADDPRLRARTTPNVRAAAVASECAGQLAGMPGAASAEESPDLGTREMGAGPGEPRDASPPETTRGEGTTRADAWPPPSAPLQPATLRVLVRIAAELGDVRIMRIRLAQLAAAEPDTADEMRTRMEMVAAAATGDADTVRALYLGTHGEDVEDAFGRAGACTPPPAHATDAALLALAAHGRRGNMRAARDLFARLRTTERRAEAYAELIRACAWKAQTGEALRLAEEMEGAGITCMPHVAAALVYALGRAQAPERASQLVARCRARGVRLDRRAYTALMNAYVEAGDGPAVLGILRWLERQTDVALRPDSAVYNTLLKAYVLRHAPLSAVLALLPAMRSRGMVPDERTYALLLQSACDAHRVDVAEALFAHADAALACAFRGATLQHFNILLQGLLAVGDRARAREVFDDMRRRGLRPNHVTYGVLIRSYAGGTAANVQRAQDLAMQLADAMLAPSAQSADVHDEALLFDDLLLPLVDAYGKRGDVTEAEAIFSHMLDLGARPSPRALSVMMNACRYAGDVSAVLRLWDHLYTTVLAQMRALLPDDADAAPVGMHQRNLVCMPLSIVIDAASRAGLHERVAQIWTQVKRDGFAFDMHNWNHMCAALARAGRVHEAMQLIERVLPGDPPPWAHSPVHLRAAADAAKDADAAEDAYAHDPLHQAAPRPVDAEPKTPPPSRPPNRRNPDAAGAGPLPRMEQGWFDPVWGGVAERRGALPVDRDVLLAPEAVWFATFETLRALQDAIERARAARRHADADGGAADPGAALLAFPTAARQLAKYQKRVAEFDARMSDEP